MGRKDHKVANLLFTLMHLSITDVHDSLQYVEQHCKEWNANELNDEDGSLSVCQEMCDTCDTIMRVLNMLLVDDEANEDNDGEESAARS